MSCTECHNKTAPPGMECWLCGPSVQLPKRNKPHLRLEYYQIPGGAPGIWAHWWRVVLVRGGRRFPHRGYTRWHETSQLALSAADVLFG